MPSQMDLEESEWETAAWNGNKTKSEAVNKKQNYGNDWNTLTISTIIISELNEKRCNSFTLHIQHINMHTWSNCLSKRMKNDAFCLVNVRVSERAHNACACERWTMKIQQTIKKYKSSQEWCINQKMFNASLVCVCMCVTDELHPSSKIRQLFFDASIRETTARHTEEMEKVSIGKWLVPYQKKKCNSNFQSFLLIFLCLILLLILISCALNRSNLWLVAHSPRYSILFQ